MQRTIELTDAEDRRLQELAQRTGQDVESLLKSLVTLSGLETERAGHVLPIQSTPIVMGGDACIRDTRIPVWLLVAYKQQGMTDSELLQAYPGLNAADLVAAWDYFAAHSHEIEQQMREHEEAA